MSTERSDSNVVDEATEAMRDLEPDVGAVDSAIERVEETLRERTAAGEALTCDDIQLLTPALRRGDLKPERARLVEDHLRSCLVCRRSRPAGSETTSASERRSGTSDGRGTGARRWPWALAAGLVVGVLLAQALLVQRFWPGAAGDATLELIEGTLLTLAVDGESPEGTAVTAGETIDYGERLVVPRGERARVELADGSRIELDERSRWAVRRGRRGTTIELDGGNLIVDAVAQEEDELYVATDDCLVSVTGTVFAVNHGTRGSRISVFEGEVHVDRQGERQVLHAGDQATTSTALARSSLGDEIAWSADRERYLALLAEVSDLNEELRAIERPGRRHSSPFLDRLPPGTAIFAALPNLGGSLDEGLTRFEERMASSEILGEWWRQHEGLATVARGLSRVAEVLGEEIAVAAWDVGDGTAGGESASSDDLAGPVVLARTDDPVALRSRLEREMSRLAEESGETVPVRVLDGAVDDPTAVDPAADGIVVWIGDGLVVAAPEAEILPSVRQFMTQDTTAFAQSAFHDTIARRYADGVESLAAIDLSRLVGRDLDSGERTELERLGIGDARHLVVERWVESDRAESRVVVTFDGERRGIAGWLAAPAPMESLGYLSPETSTATAIVFREPRLLVDELLAAIDADRRTEFRSDLGAFEDEHGWNPVDDLVDTLGGELAVAVDGPLAPEPAWKLVVEVYDPMRLRVGVERLVADVDARLRADGRGSASIETRGGVSRVDVVGPDRTREIHFTFDDGFLVAAPSAALVDRALTYSRAEYSLLDSERLRALLPTADEVNVSGLWYQDFSRMLEPLAGLGGELLGAGGGGEGERSELTPQQRQMLAEIEEGFGPMLVTAYGEEDRITLSSTSSHDPLGLLKLLLAGAASS